jgi:hypothetical protein
VLQLAPTDVEAIRAYRQILAGFGLCAGHQLVDYSRVGVLGERSHFVRLVKPGLRGSVVESVVISESGPAVTVLSATSPAGEPSALSPPEVVKLAASTVDEVCTEVAGGCAYPPYTIISQRPPADPTAGGFLSVVDLPPVPRVTQPWVGTEPARVTGNPSATACDRTRFSGNGGTRVTSRSYVIPQATQVPTLFGLTETRASFGSNRAAREFVADVAKSVSSCHRRQVTLSVPQSTSFSAHRASGWVWQFRQKVSKNKVATFRVALVCFGRRVAEVTFTPAGAYDVLQPAFITLAQRAAIRLAE